MSAPVLLGEVESPRPLRATGGRVALRGWCLLAGAAGAPPVRLVTPAGVLPMTARIARADLPGLFPSEPAAALAGFAIEGTLPAGLHAARFEAQLPDGTWQAFKQLTLAAEAASFAADLDTPLSAGVLRDRVKVGGWALDPAGPITELCLHYGHRRIPCVINQPRADVAAAFPAVPHAGLAGFTSDDFLVAGHGPVRIAAKLADGRTAIVPSRVTFSIATDENHGPELDLTAARVGLAAGAPRPLPAPPPADRPFNVLFILPGSFAANSALHVAALANELAAAGHACAVAVSHDLATLAHHAAPAFRGLLHAEAEQGVVFPDGRGPQLIHAWTSRENVRVLTEKLRARHGAKVVVHLEDNEQEILAQSLGRTSGELEKLAPADLARLVPGDLSHPEHSRRFLAQADAITVITEKLRELAPSGRPCHTIMPAADARYFYPRPRPDDFRRLLDLAADATVLFYHGNVHAANAAEVRELYAAVLQLNRAGAPVTLLRTGLDQVDFLGPITAAVAPHVLSLGQILQHRHLPPLMALADIFVQPGAPDAFNDYRFPSKLPEFFALGRPVILPRTNLGTLVRHGTDAWVLDRADADGIAAAVTELRRDRALAARLGAGAAAFAAQHFSWQRSAAALAKFYATVAA
jgi:glycosyltransferase involved in cell wall biosynthesis